MLGISCTSTDLTSRIANLTSSQQAGSELSFTAKTDKIRKGLTTKSQVRALMGEPRFKSSHNGMDTNNAHFAEGIRLLLGGIPATGVTLVNDSTLTYTTPPVTLGGPTDITIQLLEMSATLADGFTYPNSLDPHADDDGDGLTNRIEQFMALDPKVPDATAAYGALPREGKLRFVYRRSRSPGNLTGAAGWSSNLRDWSTLAVTEEVVRDNPGEEYVLIEATIGITRDEVYVRLRITE